MFSFCLFTENCLFLHLQNQMFSQNLNVFSLFSSLIDSLLVPCLGGTNPAFPYPPPHKLALTGLFAILPISSNRQPIFDKYSIFGIYNTIVLFQSSLLLLKDMNWREKKVNFVITLLIELLIVLVRFC